MSKLIAVFPPALLAVVDDVLSSYLHMYQKEIFFFLNEARLLTYSSLFFQSFGQYGAPW